VVKSALSKTEEETRRTAFQARKTKSGGVKSKGGLVRVPRKKAEEKNRGSREEAVRSIIFEISRKVEKAPIEEKTGSPKRMILARLLQRGKILKDKG